jgi:hypothetical protein
MARQDKKTYDLSEAEQRDLFNLIQQGKALPVIANVRLNLP